MEWQGRRLPAMYAESQFVDVGGLMSYGADLAHLFRRAATYVDCKIEAKRISDHEQALLP
jgi:hypothetical protein